MSQPYEEIVEGETLRRVPPGERHEAICERLHTLAALVVSQLPSTRLLPARSIIQLAPGTLLRPDLALVTAATGKLWLVAEVVHSGDHPVDTVVKKATTMRLAGNSCLICNTGPVRSLSPETSSAVSNRLRKASAESAMAMFTAVIFSSLCVHAAPHFRHCVVLVK